MAITRETLRLAKALRVNVSSITDARTRTLVRAWVRAWDELAAQIAAGIDDALATTQAGSWPSRAQIIRTQRLMEALDQALLRLDTLAAEAGVQISDDVRRAAGLGADAQPHLIASQLPHEGATTAEFAVRFDRLAPNTLDVIVARTAQQVTSVLRPLSDRAYEAMLRELIRGVAVGDNPRETARRMLARVEGQFNGGLTRALVVARTEVLDAHREAARASRVANRDILNGWVWTAALTKRTCPACWSKHGTRYPADTPGPWGHQACRCTAAPLAKSWRELGFNIDEPPSLMPDARATFNALPKADQVAIMGPARLAALNAGRVGWSQLATTRTTPGWRDSVVPTPVKAFPAA